MKYAVVMILLFGSSNFMFSQQKDPNFDKKFEDAQFFFTNEDYEKSAPIYADLYSKDSTNSNLAYRLGVSYMHIPLKTFQALSCLKNATKNANTNYKETSNKERNAPADSYYWLAKAYQQTHEFGKAIENFELYKKQNVPRGLFFADEAQRGVASCKTAQELYKKPQAVEISNIGHSINSANNELNPCVSKNDSTLIYTVKSKKAGPVDDVTQYRYQIFWSKKQASGEWSKPFDITAQIMGKGLAQSVSLSSDGKTLFLYRDEFIPSSASDVSGGDLFTSTFVNGKWSAMKPFDELNSRFDDRHASISDNGETVYFSSDRKGGLGGYDIYRIDKQANGKWSEAQNLGKAINTVSDEISPFVVKNETLYFCSEGHENVGGYDVFTSKTTGKNTWAKPTNMGVPINSPNDEMFFLPVLDGSAAYFFMARPDGYISLGGTDIYNIILNAEGK